MEERKTITFASIIRKYLKLKWNILKSVVAVGGGGCQEEGLRMIEKLFPSSSHVATFKLCNLVARALIYILMQNYPFNERHPEHFLPVRRGTLQAFCSSTQKWTWKRSKKEANSFQFWFGCQQGRRREKKGWTGAKGFFKQNDFNDTEIHAT